MLAFDACRSPSEGVGMEIASSAVGPGLERWFPLPCASRHDGYEPILASEVHCFSRFKSPANPSIHGRLAVRDPKELIQ